MESLLEEREHAKLDYSLQLESHPSKLSKLPSSHSYTLSSVIPSPQIILFSVFELLLMVFELLLMVFELLFELLLMILLLLLSLLFV